MTAAPRDIPTNQPPMKEVHNIRICVRSCSSPKKLSPFRFLRTFVPMFLIGCAAQPTQLEKRIQIASPAPNVPTAPQATSQEYATYLNRRFGFRLSYPSNLRSSRQPDNGAGMSFSSPDGEFSVTAQGHFLNGDTLDTLWANELKQGGATITYSTKKADYYVVSGSRAGREYYRKVFAEGGNWVRFDIIYPAAKRGYYDQVVERIARDFVPFVPGDYDRT